jgi:hypothetical protein
MWSTILADRSAFGDPCVAATRADALASLNGGTALLRGHLTEPPAGLKGRNLVDPVHFLGNWVHKNQQGIATRQTRYCQGKKGEGKSINPSINNRKGIRKGEQTREAFLQATQVCYHVAGDEPRRRAGSDTIWRKGGKRGFGFSRSLNPLVREEGVDSSLTTKLPGAARVRVASPPEQLLHASPREVIFKGEDPETSPRPKGTARARFGRKPGGSGAHDTPTLNGARPTVAVEYAPDDRGRAGGEGEAVFLGLFGVSYFPKVGRMLVVEGNLVGDVLRRGVISPTNNDTGFGGGVYILKSPTLHPNK